MILRYLILSSFLVPVNLHSLSKRQDTSYGSPAYKYCECGRKNKKPSEIGRIIGGNETLNNEYPWMAVITVIDDTNQRIICGGSLISDQYVLSAAHCLRPKYTQSQIKVILGEHDICKTDVRSVTFSVEKFIQHPKYVKSQHLFADVMLIKLNMRVTFNEYVRPICLPRRVGKENTESKYGGKIGDVLGWGIGDTMSVSCVLRKTNLILYKSDKCPYKPFDLFCAGYPGGVRDACSGDSGGPFQIPNDEGKYELIGIVSSGIACGDPEAPGLFTDVLRSLSWIYKASQDSMYCWR